MTLDKTSCLPQSATWSNRSTLSAKGEESTCTGVAIINTTCTMVLPRLKCDSTHLGYRFLHKRISMGHKGTRRQGKEMILHVICPVQPMFLTLYQSDVTLWLVLTMPVNVNATPLAISRSILQSEENSPFARIVTQPQWMRMDDAWRRDAPA